MKAYQRALIVLTSAAMATPIQALAGEAAAAAPPPAAIQPAEPPAKPSTVPAGFPVLAVPLAIVIGIAVATGTEDNNAEFPTSTGTTGTAP